MSQSSFAKLIDVSQQQISKYVKSGVLKTVNNRGQIDSEDALVTLNDLGKIDDNGKYIKRDSIQDNNSASLPFYSVPGYETMADLSDEDRKALEDKAKNEAELKLADLDAVASKAGIELTKDQKEFIKSATLAEAKRKREAADAIRSEIDIKLKMMEKDRKELEDKIKADLYVLKEDVDAEARRAGSDVIAAIESAIDRLGPRLLMKESSHETKQIMRLEFHKSLKGLIQ
ncbi:hypothetical protein PGH07_07860 [Sulfurovum sp. zt1-1]|uniref:Uncharacterized protein n=1 Tax=Sulfurovum zhangzhouensis TaxID=3019067 RepID=A0ABT7QZ76_9BACT|nr:hypothetical protein [Sulfurovum zhangzhouensis]MDM5272092.1 hypothetical protein [Sulfurovum zhangzhouensis]